MSPEFPPNTGSPLPDDPRGGAETSQAASHQNSYPSHQGPDDEANDLRQASRTRDPRRSAAPPQPPSTLPPTLTRSLHPEPLPPQPITSRIVYKQIPTLTSALPTPTLLQSSHGIHPSRVAQLETNAFSPTIDNSEPPIVATPSPILQPSTLIQPVPTSRSESTPSIQSQPPVGMHPDRIALLPAPIQPSSVVTSTQIPSHVTSSGLQQHPPPDGHLIDRSRSLPTFLSGRNAPLPPPGGSIPLSSRIALDDVGISTAPGLPPLVSFNTLSNSDSQYIPRSPIQSPIQSKGGQKRKASEVFPLPERPEPLRMPKTGKGNNTGGTETAKSRTRPKKRKRRKGKANLNGQPGPSNLYHQGGEAEGENDGNNVHAYEDGEMHDGYEHGEEPYRNLAHTR